MAYFRELLLSSAAGVAALALAAPAFSQSTLLEGTGWQNDTITAAGAPSAGSPITFVCDSSEPGENCVFSLSDAFVPGDHYTITGDVSASSSLKLFSSAYFEVGNDFGPAAGDYAPAWTDPRYEHLQFWITPGTYTISLTGDGAGGIPAGVGYRLDSFIPEPATWALMLVGFGGLGMALRASRRREAVAA